MQSLRAGEWVPYNNKHTGFVPGGVDSLKGSPLQQPLKSHCKAAATRAMARDATVLSSVTTITATAFILSPGSHSGFPIVSVTFLTAVTKFLMKSV